MQLVTYSYTIHIKKKLELFLHYRKYNKPSDVACEPIKSTKTELRKEETEFWSNTVSSRR